MYVINVGFPFAVSPVPVAVTVVADRAVPVAEGDSVLPARGRVGVCTVDVDGRDDRGGVDGVYPYIARVVKEIKKG